MYTSKTIIRTVVMARIGNIVIIVIITILAATEKVIMVIVVIVIWVQIERDIIKERRAIAILIVTLTPVVKRRAIAILIITLTPVVIVMWKE